jgi:hypothetical protein
VPEELTPLLAAVVVLLGVSAVAGGVRVFADGVYRAELLSAFEPPDGDAEDAKEEAAPAPLAPDEALA